MNTYYASPTKVSDKLKSLVEEYDDLFHGLGNITNYTHKINIDSNVKAVSQPLRRIPLSQVEAVGDEIFDESKQVLACFELGCPTFLIADASPVGLGTMLVQKQCDNELKSVAYISRSLSPTEKRY